MFFFIFFIFKVLKCSGQGLICKKKVFRNDDSTKTSITSFSHTKSMSQAKKQGDKNMKVFSFLEHSFSNKKVEDLSKRSILSQPFGMKLSHHSKKATKSGDVPPFSSDTRIKGIGLKCAPKQTYPVTVRKKISRHCATKSEFDSSKSSKGESKSEQLEEPIYAKVIRKRKDSKLNNSHIHENFNDILNSKTSIKNLDMFKTVNSCETLTIEPPIVDMQTKDFFANFSVSKTKISHLEQPDKTKMCNEESRPKFLKENPFSHHEKMYSPSSYSIFATEKQKNLKIAGENVFETESCSLNFKPNCLDKEKRVKLIPKSAKRCLSNEKNDVEVVCKAKEPLKLRFLSEETAVNAEKEIKTSTCLKSDNITLENGTSFTPAEKEIQEPEEFEICPEERKTCQDTTVPCVFSEIRNKVFLSSARNPVGQKNGILRNVDCENEDLQSHQKVEKKDTESEKAFFYCREDENNKMKIVSQYQHHSIEPSSEDETEISDLLGENIQDEDSIVPKPEEENWLTEEVSDNSMEEGDFLLDSDELEEVHNTVIGSEIEIPVAQNGCEDVKDSANDYKLSTQSEMNCSMVSDEADSSDDENAEFLVDLIENPPKKAKKISSSDNDSSSYVETSFYSSNASLYTILEEDEETEKPIIKSILKKEPQSIAKMSEYSQEFNSNSKKRVSFNLPIDNTSNLASVTEEE